MGTEGMLEETPKPDGQDCTWCGAPATNVVEIRKQRGTFMYVCDAHLRNAELANETRKN